MKNTVIESFKMQFLFYILCEIKLTMQVLDVDWLLTMEYSKVLKNSLSDKNMEHFVLDRTSALFCFMYKCLFYQINQRTYLLTHRYRSNKHNAIYITLQHGWIGVSGWMCTYIWLTTYRLKYCTLYIKVTKQWLFSIIDNKVRHIVIGNECIVPH